MVVSGLVWPWSLEGIGMICKLDGISEKFNFQTTSSNFSVRILDFT